MKPYVILTDAACDADAAVLKKENISFIPMDYSLGDEMRSCLPPELPAIMKAFYDGQRKGDLTKTSQVSLSSYEAAMLPWLEKGFSILYLALSSGLSSTYQTAATVCELLQERFPNATILAVDTKAATGGMGILLERAIQNREKGLGVCENAMDLMETIPHLHHWFMVQDIQYLHRGGRLGTITATVGTVFRLRPILQIDADGTLQTIGRARGTHKAVHELIERYEENRAEQSCRKAVFGSASSHGLG